MKATQHTPRLSTARWSRWLSTLLVAALLLNAPASLAQAQDGDPNDPTPTIEVLVGDGDDAIMPPDATPGDVTPDATENLPEGSETPEPGTTPEASPTPEVTATAETTPDPMIEPTPTATTTALKEEPLMPAGDWTLEYDLVFTEGQVAAAGGLLELEADLRAFLAGSLTEDGLAFSLESLGSEDEARYLLRVQGDGGAEQLRRVIHLYLAERLRFLGGVINLVVEGITKGGSAFDVRLDAQIASGSSWRLEPNALVRETAASEHLTLTSLPGAPGIQRFSLASVADGAATLTFKYASPWVADQPATRRIWLQAALDADLDLSNLVAPPEVVQPEPPPLEEGAEMGISGTVPASFDWRDHGALPSIRNQGTCGSCYTFATVGVMEATMRINGVNQDLSEQFLVSCTQNYNMGCDGGYPDSHKYHVSSLAQQQSNPGAVLESDMPYRQYFWDLDDTEADCYTMDNHPYQLLSWHRVNSSWGSIPSTDTLKRTIYTKGPVAVSVCSKDAYHNYDGGIFTTNESCGSSKINHLVILTGWFTDPTHGTVWIMRNSWGEWWGDDGYMYIKAGTSNVGMDATYVIYQPLPDRLAPLVTKVDSYNATSDKKVLENEDVTVNINKLYIYYDETMHFADGVDDVTTLSNYSLLNLGANGVLGGGDDTPVDINSASYSSKSKQVTLAVNYGAFLPDAAYRLTISGSGTVKDVNGLLLDGDANGLAGGDFIRNFRISVKPGTPVLFAPAKGGYTSDSTPTFVWYSTSHAQTYEFMLDDSSKFSSPERTWSGGATSHTPAALPDGKWYWRVRGVNRYGVPGSWSSVFYVTTDAVNPTAPLLKAPLDLGAYRDTTTFSWNNVADANYYRFRMTTLGGALLYESPVLTGTSHRPPDSDLGDCRWQAQAGDAAGNWSNWSEARMVTILPLLPVVPKLLAPASGAFTNDATPLLDWVDVPDATGYEVQVDTSSKFPAPTTQIAAVSQHTFASLGEGKYYWRVRAHNQGMEYGPWSSGRSFTVDLQPPDAPLLSVPPIDGSVYGTPTFTWKAVSGANAYELRYETAGGAPEYTSPPLTKTSHKPPNMPLGVHRWTVRARDAAGNWSAPAGLQAVTIQAPLPGKPPLVAPGSGAYTNDNTPQLDWYAVDYAVQYQVQVSTSSKFTDPAADATTGSTAYTTPALLDGKYYWRVRGQNSVGAWGSWSTARSFTVDRLAPPAPLLSKPDDASTYAGTPVYSWKSASGAKYYRFRYTTTGGTVLYTSPDQTTTAHKPPAQPLGSYRWQAQAGDLAGNWSGWSEYWTITITLPVPGKAVLVSPASKSTTTDTTLTLDWNPVDYAATYDVQISDSSRFINIIQAIPVGAPASEVTAGALTPSYGYYYWRVRAVNASGAGAWSTYKYFKVLLP